MSGALTQQGAASEPKPVDRGKYVGVVIVGVAAILVIAFLVLTLGKAADTSKASAGAGVLALVTALAVGIERVLEAFWTLVDRLAKNPSWPFSSDAELMNNLADQLSSKVKAPLEEVNKFLGSADDDANKLLNDKPQIQDQVNKLLDSVNKVLSGQEDPKSWRRLNALQVGLGDLKKQLGSAGTGANLTLAVSTLDTLYGWIDSLLMNPGRKIMSLFAGSLVGLVAAWLFGLDLVHAALNVAPPPGWAWGMALTGIVVGLGANPTHELIHAIQSYKQSEQP
jgi:hypothetical protein